MKIVKPSVEMLFWKPENGKTAEEAIEWAARTCYKSEDKTKDGSAEKLVKRLRRRGHHAMLEFGYIMARIVADRGLTHELVRHRLASFAQESTRYCNYSNDKFESEITVIEPPGLSEVQKVIWTDAMWNAETSYMELMMEGCKPEIARSVLPIGLKTEIVIGANTREWMHIFKMRCDEAAHPIIRGVMQEAYEQCKEKIPAVFEEL